MQPRIDDEISTSIRDCMLYITLLHSLNTPNPPLWYATDWLYHVVYVQAALVGTYEPSENESSKQ